MPARLFTHHRFSRITSQITITKPLDTDNLSISGGNPDSQKSHRNALKLLSSVFQSLGNASLTAWCRLKLLTLEQGGAIFLTIQGCDPAGIVVTLLIWCSSSFGSMALLAVVVSQNGSVATVLHKTISCSRADLALLFRLVRCTVPRFIGACASVRLPEGLALAPVGWGFGGDLAVFDEE